MIDFDEMGRWVYMKFNTENTNDNANVPVITNMKDLLICSEVVL